MGLARRFAQAFSVISEESGEQVGALARREGMWPGSRLPITDGLEPVMLIVPPLLTGGGVLGMFECGDVADSGKRKALLPLGVGSRDRRLRGAAGMLGGRPCVDDRPAAGEYAISLADKLHVLFDVGWSPGIGRVIVCNSDLQLAARYGDAINKGRDPNLGTTYEWPGLRHLVVRFAGSSTYWFTAISLWYPIALCGALPTVWAVSRLWRSRCRFSLRTLLLGMSAVAFFFGCWSLTSAVGTGQVTEHLARKLAVDELLREPSCRVERDPIATDNYDSDETIPCHYVGNASTPFPLVVTVDWAVLSHRPAGGGLLGGSGRATFLWLFGLNLPLTHWDRAGTYLIGE